MKKSNQQDTPRYPVYRVTVHGTDVEFTPDLKSAEDAFKESRSQVNLWAVQADGSAKLLKQKL